MEEEAISNFATEDPPLPRLTLVLGGARSGKSRFAESLVTPAGGGTYIATGEARDDEMRARIERHRARRGACWRTVEAPLNLVSALDDAESRGDPILVDCLTLWLSNLMEAGCDIEAETDHLISHLAREGCPIVLVSNEVGQGIVPDNPLARRFRDHAGLLHQAVAAAADRAYLVTAGIPLLLK